MKLTKRLLPNGWIQYGISIQLYIIGGEYRIFERCPAVWLKGKHTQKRAEFAIRLIRARGYARHIHKRLTT